MTRVKVFKFLVASSIPGVEIISENKIEEDINTFISETESNFGIVCTPTLNYPNGNLTYMICTITYSI